MKPFDIEALLRRIEADLLTKQDEHLIKMIISKNTTQEELDSFLLDWNQETAGPARSLLLSYLRNAHPELVFPESIVLQLKSTSDYFRFRNMRLIAQYNKLASGLASKGITVTIFKGGALKYLRPLLPRRMSDIDVLVSASDYKSAGETIESFGYDVSWDEHSFDVHEHGSEEGILDVHKFIPMLTGRESNIMGDVLSRAKKTEIFGVKSQILIEEDLVFSLLVNLSRNIMNNTSTGGVLFTFIDLSYLIESKQDFNWNILIDNAFRSGSEKMLAFAVNFVNSIVPGLLPEFIHVSDEEFCELATIVKYRRYLLCPLQERSHRLGVVDVLKSPGLIPEFLSVRPRYTFLKLFRKRPKIAGLILSIHD